MEDRESAEAPLVPHNKYLAVFAAAGLALSLLELSHLAALPLGTWITGSTASLLSTSSLLNLMRNLGYLSLFALMTLESASVPIPSEIVLPFAGYLVFIGVMDFYVAVLVSTAAGLAGALIDYYLAYFLGRPFVVAMLKAFGLRPSSLERAEKWFKRSGQWTVFAARFVPVLRSVISLPAGLFRMRMRPFAAMTVIGCLGWSAILVYAGYLAGGTLSTVFESSAGLLVDALSVGLAGASVAYIAYFAFWSMRKSGKVRGDDEARTPSVG